MLEEPPFGNPICIQYNKKRVSFALLNSILEIDVLFKNLNPQPKSRFLEIGAGSGRTTLSLLKLMPEGKFIIVDIPPALYISQENIVHNLPDKEAFKFRNFSNYEEVKAELENADIAFLSPEQIRWIPDGFVDISLAIDCLHEMTQSNVERWFSRFNRISKHLYFRCQIVQWAKTSDVLYTIDSYPVQPHWRKVIHKKCYIPNDYFEAIYQLREG